MLSPQREILQKWALLLVCRIYRGNEESLISALSFLEFTL
jgi:hypothetical protein